ncbi:MAG TPA: hypothetical protein VME18_10570 [Acidobacteriaceae bacterium]|nr:hypothetical protein [Acidobacteriaceae bacterium]
MPTLDATEYERFSLDQADQNPLPLDEAVKKAAEMRRNDPVNFYRVEYANESQSGFVVNKVEASTVYAEFFARMAKLFGRMKLSS